MADKAAKAPSHGNGTAIPAAQAMRSRLIELEDYWLELRCGRCGRIGTPAIRYLIRKLGPEHCLGVILPRLKCERCGTPPAEAWLNESHNRERNGGGAPGWSVRLMPPG